MEAEERNEAEYGKDLSHTQRNWHAKDKEYSTSKLKNAPTYIV